VATPDPAEARHRNQHRIDALRDQVIAHREGTAERLAHESREVSQEVTDARYRDDDQLEEDTDMHSGLGY
jgi:hypothetical protein